MKGRPTAAPAHFPYAHRTVEQVDAHAAASAGMADEREGRLSKNGTVAGSKMLLAAIQRVRSA